MNMKKALIALVILTIPLIGCGSQQTQTQQTSLPQPQAPQPVPQQEQPKPEEPATPACTDECETDSCTGIKQVACTLGTNGCKQKISRGVVKGKCGVECFFNSDCKTGMDCASYKCVAKK